MPHPTTRPERPGRQRPAPFLARPRSRQRASPPRQHRRNLERWSGSLWIEACKLPRAGGAYYPTLSIRGSRRRGRLGAVRQTPGTGGHHMRMRRMVAMALAAFMVSALPAVAHHGWGGNSQDEFEITGTVEQAVSLAGPHATM